MVDKENIIFDKETINWLIFNKLCLLSLLNKIKMNWFSEMENKLIKFVEESIWELKMVARLFAGKKKILPTKSGIKI